MLTPEKLREAADVYEEFWRQDYHQPRGTFCVEAIAMRRRAEVLEAERLADEARKAISELIEDMGLGEITRLVGENISMRSTLFISIGDIADKAYKAGWRKNK